MFHHVLSIYVISELFNLHNCFKFKHLLIYAQFYAHHKFIILLRYYHSTDRTDRQIVRGNIFLFTIIFTIDRTKGKTEKLSENVFHHCCFLLNNGT